MELWGGGWGGVLSTSAGDLGCRAPKNINLLKCKLGFPDLFPMFTQSVNFCILYCHKIKDYRCLKNAIHQLERNKWLLLSAFQQGFWQKLRTNFGLFLHTGKRFFLELSF